MILNYDKINISINGDYILAESASLNQNAERKPVYSLNNSKPYDNIPAPIRNSLSLTYFIEPKADPSYKLITGWKNNTTGNLNCIINMGDVLFPAYLDSYSFDILPNQLVKCQSSYSIFNELTGTFSNQNINDSSFYNLQNGTGQAHYWASYFTSGSSFTTIDNNILQLNYSFNSNLIPSYKLGSPFPSQVSVIDATEQINIVNEIQNNVSFSGQNYNVIFNNGIDNIRLKNLSSLWGDTSKSIDFVLSGFQIQSNKTDISIDNLVIFSHNLRKYY